MLTAATITDTQIREYFVTPVNPQDVISISGAADPHAVSLVVRAKRIMCGDALDAEEPLRTKARARVAAILNARDGAGQ